MGDTTIEFSPTQHFGNVRSVVMMHTCVEKSMSVRNRVRDLRSMSTGRVPSRWLPLNHPPHHPTIRPHLGWAKKHTPGQVSSYIIYYGDFFIVGMARKSFHLVWHSLKDAAGAAPQHLHRLVHMCRPPCQRGYGGDTLGLTFWFEYFFARVV